MIAATTLWGLVGCRGPECKLDDPKSCPSEQICERVEGREQAMCFAPVQLEGRVFDLATSGGIEGAQVSALDINGSPVGTVAVSGADGKYALRVPSVRSDDKGAFTPRVVTLRAAAQDYEIFPSGLRVALPVDTAGATAAGDDKPYVLVGGLTDIGLIHLAEGDRGDPSISGKVQVAVGQKGVLVVAGGGAKARSTIAAENGDFTLFNVEPGGYKLSAYSAGQNYTPVELSVEGGRNVTGVAINRSNVAPATLTGTAKVVAGTGLTSVVLVVRDTFNQQIIRGEVPPGLRAPAPGTAPNINGDFSIEGVPDGEYVVLAAYENDDLVRDPNTGTAGTGLQFVTIANGQPSGQPDFKITTAIAIVGPGATGIEPLSGTPTFRWTAYPQSKDYRIQLFDALGNEVWNAGGLAPGSSGTLSQAYGGPALGAGGVYQWRITAYNQAGIPISTSEDLEGIFTVQ
jgi:hypothetical protein